MCWSLRSVVEWCERIYWNVAGLCFTIKGRGETPGPIFYYGNSANSQFPLSPVLVRPRINIFIVTIGQITMNNVKQVAHHDQNYEPTTLLLSSTDYSSTFKLGFVFVVVRVSCLLLWYRLTLTAHIAQLSDAVSSQLTRLGTTGAAIEADISLKSYWRPKAELQEWILDLKSSGGQKYNFKWMLI